MNISVLDLSTTLAGAYCARLYGAVGADVVLVETPAGHPLRQAPPLLRSARNGRPPLSAAHAYVNAYKRGLVLDLDAPAAGPVLECLYAQADMVVSTFDGDDGAVRRRHDHIQAVNPRAVHVVASGFGLTGPYRAFRASDIVEGAMSGHLYVTGHPQREPVHMGGPWTGYLTGVTAATAAFGALFEARRAGRGQLVDVNAMEAMAALHQWSLTLFTHQGVIKRRASNRHAESYHPMGFERCNDGWVCIGVATVAQWENFCMAVDLPELIADPRFATGGNRFDHADALDALLAPWLMARTSEAVVQHLQSHHVPASRVLALDEVLRDPSLEARAYWVTPEAFGVDARMPGTPFRIGGDDVPFRPAPALGEHSLDVLRAAGLDAAHIHTLVESGVAPVSASEGGA